MKKLLFCVINFIVLLTGVVHAQTPQYTYTANATGGNYIPFGVSAGWPNYRSQFFYFPGDFVPTVPASPGFIQTIYFRCYTGYSTTGTVFKDLTVSIGNTTVTAPTNYVTGLTPALYDPAFSLPSVIGGNWFAIPLSTPIYVDLSQPLVIDVSQSGGSAGFPIFAGGTPVNSAYSGNTHIYGPTPSASGTGRRYSYQFGFDFFAGYPCTDTPKSLVDAQTPQCPKKPFIVKPATYYADADYKWQYSDDGGITWKNYAGPVGLYADIKDSITASRTYRCIITCINSGFSYITPPKKIDVAEFYYCYCDNKAGTSSGLDIGNVSLFRLPEDYAILNNGVSTPAIANNTATKAYTTFQYSVPPIPIYRDSSFKISVSAITGANTMPATANVVTYIDFNRNGKFDANEKVLKKAITGASITPNTESATFTVPHTAEIGLTGMRVIMGTGTLDSCGTFTGEGEVEDYLVDIRYEPCDNADNPGRVDLSDTALCSGYDYLTTDTTYEKFKSELQRTWQISGDNVVWADINSSDNKDQLLNVFGKQPLYYRVRQICPRRGGDTTYTAPALIKAKDGYKCYCYSQAVGGLVKDSSDIGGISIGNYVMNLGGPHTLNPLARKKRTDHTDDPPLQLYRDSTYKMTVYHTQFTQDHSDAKVTVFMDFNNDKKYDVPYEKIYTNYTSLTNFTLQDTFTVPPIVITGVPTGMRIILNNDITPNDPSDKGCGGYISGETHDYVVVFNNKPFPESVGKIEGMNNFGLFPNPTTGKFHIQFTSRKAMNEVVVTVKNVTGQVVAEQAYQHKGGAFDADMDMSKQPRGIYFVELQSAGEKAIQKLVVE